MISPPVLRAVKKAKKSVSTRKHKDLEKQPVLITCAQPVPKTAVRELPTTEPALLAGCSPEILRLVHQHLESPRPEDRLFLDAWERCGRKDAKGPARVHVSRQAKSTVSALGLACLVRYARGYEDEHQVLELRAERKAH